MKKFILCAVAILLILPASTINVYSEENSGASFMPPAEESSIYSEGYPKQIPEYLETQFFCGYCHILTYPRVIKKAHNSWITSKHKEVSCVDCHYPPGRLDVPIPEHDKIPRDEETANKKKTDVEYMKSELEVLSRLTTILSMDEPVIRKKPRIDDTSCTTKCHLMSGEGKEGEFWAKEISFVESEREDKSKRVIKYIHKTHFDATKSVEGQEMHCQTCHQHETSNDHFEVNRQKCFLCHFKNATLNEGRAKCSLCHKIPTKPLQRQKKEGDPVKEGEKTINHKSIEADGVKCASCHGHMIRGKGEVVQQLCLDCHDNEEAITKEVSNKKLMHEQHVAAQNASCFDCHTPIEHDKKADYLDNSRLECQTCHPDHHKYQKILLDGPKRPGVSNIPGLMGMVYTNCTACHFEEKIVKGEIVAGGTAKACSACHLPKHEGMVEEWKSKTASASKEAWEIEKDAVAAIETAKTTATPDQIAEANTMLEAGRENLGIVEYGGGVHNKKYSITLIDAAMTSFEDAMELFEEEEEEDEEEDEEVEVDCECDDGELDCADEDAEEEAEEYGCECDNEDELVCEGGEDEDEDEDEDEEEEE